MDASEASELGRAASDAVLLYQKCHEGAESLGAQWKDTLPQVAVLGKQSCGKSSVLTGLTGTHLPSRDGTCTKCPILINSRHTNGPGACSFQQFRFDGGTFCAKDRDDMTIQEDNWHLMPDRIWQLQEELLQGRARRPEQPFTKDMVVLNIEGSHCYDISVVDLPGLIAPGVTGADEVLGIAESFAKRSNVVIVACLCCDDDLENQAVLSVVKKFDADGKRTIGVLTKPDRVEEGNQHAEGRVLKILRGEHEDAKLQHGWYVVRRPNAMERERDATGDSADGLEAEFFEGHPFGIQLRSTRPTRCGCRKLQEYIAKKIIAPMVHHKVRELYEPMERARNATVHQLEEMGPQIDIDNVQEYLMTTTATLARAIKETVQGLGDADQAFTETVKAFTFEARDELEGTMPMFKLTDDVTYPPKPCPAAAASDAGQLEPWSLAGVKELLLQKRGRDIFTGPERERTTRALLKRSIAHWLPIADKCRSNITQALEQHCLQAIAACRDLDRDPLNQRVREEVKLLIKQSSQQASGEVRKCLQSESRIFTVHQRRLDEAVNSIKLSIEEFIRNAQYDPEMDSAAMAMAQAIAYFEISWERFADTLCMVIDRELLDGFADKLEAQLRQRLGLLSVPKQELMQLIHDPEVLARQECLERQRAAQDSALEAIGDYMAAHGICKTVRVPLAGGGGVVRRSQAETGGSSSSEAQ